ncbi:MAG: winged helix-turn-helix domain-containing protein [Nitrosopumilus sp.]|uniref:ArsR/SmtB family transcription factor n=1 Tax=Nitrosopumilus sp. TaxID=2024843 RepID=UPI00247CE8FD|nr:winged helix-turn-helix domain-containing protein [Nitrosopumilus sp.]MCV0391949.1 winged helix-turn-helix domain-containing protein [Nitrosopumilus sp.]
MNSEDDEIEIISTDDDKIKLIGEIFSNDSSRKILKLISDGNEMTANEIAQESNMSLALAIHHLKRMQTAGMIKVSKTGISAKGQEMKYYVSTNQTFLITPEKSNSSVIESLKKFSKFAAIGLAGFVSWITLKPNNANYEGQPHTPGIESSTSEEQFTKDIPPESNPEVNLEVRTGESTIVEPEPQMEPIPEPEPEPQPEPSHSGTEYFDFSADTDATNTGSVSLDRTVYPQPFEGVNGDTTEQLIFAIIISLGIIAGGIILERILTYWFTKRKENKKSRGHAK